MNIRHLLVKTPLAIVMVIQLSTVSAQKQKQQVLLVGTKHETAESELVQINPVRDAVIQFNPTMICVQFSRPNDSVSLRYLYGSGHFKKQDSIRRAWKLQPKKNDAERIAALLKQLERNSGDLFARMELRNIFHVRSDFGNAEYQRYIMMQDILADSSRAPQLRKKYPMFDAMKRQYERAARAHDEYHSLVFPLASELKIGYLRPIDDQRNSRDYEKYFRRLSRRDSILENRKAYFSRVDAFTRRMKTLPPETNLWVYNNSPEMIDNLLYVQGYRLDPSATSPDVKRLSLYWTLRNKKMAGYVNDVAKANPTARIVVFASASHTGALQEELRKIQKKKYAVITLYDILEN